MMQWCSNDVIEEERRREERGRKRRMKRGERGTCRRTENRGEKRGRKRRDIRGQRGRSEKRRENRGEREKEKEEGEKRGEEGVRREESRRSRGEDQEFDSLLKEMAACGQLSVETAAVFPAKHFNTRQRRGGARVHHLYMYIAHVYVHVYTDYVSQSTCNHTNYSHTHARTCV